MKTILFFFITLTSLVKADLASDKKTLVKSHTDFAFSLYPVLKTEEENLVFSPYAIATCLSMAYLGARADTETQMQSALHLDLGRKQLSKASSFLAQSLLPMKKEDNSFTLNLANALWIDEGTFLLTDFRYTLEEQFKAKLGSISFSNPSSALSTINEWTSQQTQGKIPHLLTASEIGEKTRLVLTNALYFQGTFHSPFFPSQTREAPFYPTPDRKVQVNMMRQTLSAPHFENDLAHLIALPVQGMNQGGSELAFVVVFPKSDENFGMVTHELSGSYDDWISSLKEELIDLSLPKFTFSDRFDLSKTLQDLGMEDAFNASANFAGIDGMRDLVMNKVVHQSFFSVDEQGISAAAATAVTMKAKGAAITKPNVTLVIDHPFLFFLIDLKSHEVLFMGKVSKFGETQ